jgi:hypothetical protein
VTSIAIYLLGKDLMMLQEELKAGYDRGAEGGLDIRGTIFGASHSFFYSIRNFYRACTRELYTDSCHQ